MPGNIDIHNRPVAHNPNGSISTVLSMSIGTDKGEVLIPMVIGGKVVGKKEAIRHYEQTGEHLGIFDTPEHATAYARALHEQQAHEYGGAATHNNPGNLRVPGSMEFQSFATPQEGVHAQEAQLHRYFGRGLHTVSGIVETYAPRKSRGGDNTDEQVNNYIRYVAHRLGVNPDDALSPATVSRLGEAMREFETGRRVD